MATSSAPCGGDAYRPWGDAPSPTSREFWTCDTCAHASQEAAEAAASAWTGLDMTGRLPEPFGKCLGAAGLEVVR